MPKRQKTNIKGQPGDMFVIVKGQGMDYIKPVSPGEHLTLGVTRRKR